jgi:hypothetical protein
MIKALLCALFAVSLGVQAPADDATGIWKVEFVGPMGDRPRTVSGMLLELDARGSKLTGVAHMKNWPDCAYISDGTITGNRVTFTANSKSPWNSDTLTGYPRLRFTGTIRGDQINLVVNWGSVVTGGLGNKPVKDLEQPGNDLPMEGRRLR